MRSGSICGFVWIKLLNGGLIKNMFIILIFKHSKIEIMYALKLVHTLDWLTGLSSGYLNE